MPRSVVLVGNCITRLDKPQKPTTGLDIKDARRREDSKGRQSQHFSMMAFS
jgi:hypothetical protein